VLCDLLVKNQGGGLSLAGVFLEGCIYGCMSGLALMSDPNPDFSDEGLRKTVESNTPEDLIILTTGRGLSIDVLFGMLIRVLGEKGIRTISHVLRFVQAGYENTQKKPMCFPSCTVKIKARSGFILDQSYVLDTGKQIIYKAACIRWMPNDRRGVASDIFEIEHVREFIDAVMSRHDLRADGLDDIELSTAELTKSVEDMHGRKSDAVTSHPSDDKAQSLARVEERINKIIGNSRESVIWEVEKFPRQRTAYGSGEYWYNDFARRIRVDDDGRFNDPYDDDDDDDDDGY
jgi:hypothetical protein